MAARIPPGARPKWQPTPTEQTAMDAAIAALDEEAGPPTEAEIQAARSVFLPALQDVLARREGRQ